MACLQGWFWLIMACLQGWFWLIMACLQGWFWLIMACLQGWFWLIMACLEGRFWDSPIWHVYRVFILAHLWHVYKDGSRSLWHVYMSPHVQCLCWELHWKWSYSRTLKGSRNFVGSGCPFWMLSIHKGDMKSLKDRKFEENMFDFVVGTVHGTACWCPSTII